MIYIHVPFCRSFCTYCDFYSEIGCGGEAFVKELLEEIEARSAEIAGTLERNTLYIGGGTPSVLPLSCLERIVKALEGFGPFEEFTIEVNPDDITPEYTLGLRKLGVNRVSMGVQCLDDRVLRWMNRRHTASDAAKAFRTIREAGFDNVSVDVIFGLSADAAGYDTTVLEKTLEQILEWKPEHVSAYQLSIEEGSVLGSLTAEGKYREAPEELCREQYYLICRELGKAGYTHYEISNWALPGYESRHNSAYWSRTPYVGLGPGAHSLRTDGGCQVRSWNSPVLCGWKAESETLSAEEIREEEIMLGLRTERGVVIDGKRQIIPEEDWFIADNIIAGYL